MAALYIGRLAPSPTGALHLGNARTFLITWLCCRAQKGVLKLRMEDLDHPKVKPWASAQAYEDLGWLGLDWDAGPMAAGPEPPNGAASTPDPYVQSGRMEGYEKALHRLKERGLIYPCTCTRKDILSSQSAPHAGEEMRYPNTCRGRYRDEGTARAESGRDPCWRLDIRRLGSSSWLAAELPRTRTTAGQSVRSASSDTWIDGTCTGFDDGFCGLQESDLAEWSGDFVVARGEDKPAYHLAVVVDDVAMGVTEVIRADDLVASTHRQLALYHALGHAPPAFFHVPLVVGPDGRRLAKRHGDTRVSLLRERGTPADQVVGWLAATCGWAEPGEKLMPRELLDRFDPDTIDRASVVVDETVLQALGLA